MDTGRIRKAYQEYIGSEIFKNHEKYRKLSDGKSAEVFFNDVKSRVNMEYMGIVNHSGLCDTYEVGENGINKTAKGTPLKDLVVGNGILQATTRLFAEYATSKPLIIQSTDSELIQYFDFDDLLGKLMVIQSWAGRQLLKGVTDGEVFSFYPVTPKDYFKVPNIYNPKLIDGYVIFNLNKKNSEDEVMCEIYEKDSIQYKAYKILGDGFVEVSYPLDLTMNGMIREGLGFYDPNARGWGVVEIENIFGKPDYNDDLIGLVRELVVGDTLTSQAFQKVANPLLQVPESLIEVGSDGQSSIMLDGRVVALRKEDRDVKQVRLETKTNEWRLHKEDIKNDIYKQLGINDLAFGIDIGGSIASGEAKRRSLERTIATIESKRNKCIDGIVNIVIWGHERLGRSIDFKIKPQDILSLSLTEKISIACQAVTAGVMSVCSAIEFLGINANEEELEGIQSDLNYKEKLVAILSTLSSISRESSLKEKVDEMTVELMNELGISIETEVK